MIKDKNTCLKIIEAILFANSDLVDEKDLTKNIPKNFNIKKLLTELKNVYKNKGINIYNVKNKWGFRTAPSMSNFLKIEKNLKKFFEQKNDEWVPLDNIFKNKETNDFIIKSYKASHFSASLELAKEGVIDIRQHANFAPIYIKKTSSYVRILKL